MSSADNPGAKGRIHRVLNSLSSDQKLVTMNQLLLRARTNLITVFCLLMFRPSVQDERLEGQPVATPKFLAVYVQTVLTFLLATGGTRAQAVRVSLTPSIPSPSPVGTTVTWSARPSNSTGHLQFRFQVRPRGEKFGIIRDFSSKPTLDWTESKHEGLYEIEVTVRDRSTGVAGSTSLEYQINSLAGETPVITPTPNPLVFLYSAPPCRPSGRMRVEFESPEGYIQHTPYENCAPGMSMNFYLAGLRASATYTVHHTIESRFGVLEGPTLTVTTLAIPVKLPVSTILQSAERSPDDGVWLYSNLFGPSFATDSAGNAIWYYPANFTLLTRPESGGRFLALVANQAAAGFGQTLREFDVAGNTLRETNTARINEQLAAMGKRTIGVFHHDALTLPDGELVALATTERVLTGAQGPGPVDIIGDMILLLNQDLQVVWTWDAFDHLDVHRGATLGETCPGLGCPPISMASHANDWLHGNALQFTADGNLLYSSRHQDWIIKIDFRGGLGTGDVIWRLGKDGDFQINSGDPSPWFSHQHGPQFAPGDPTLLSLFDDSNLRQSVDRNAHSRGQVLQLDEPNRIATLLLNADLGGFSFAVGNAQPLLDGNYQFDVGWLPDNTSRSVELNPFGDQLSAVTVNTPQYRSFRMRDLYMLDTDRTPSTERLRRVRGPLFDSAGR